MAHAWASGPSVLGPVPSACGLVVAILLFLRFGAVCLFEKTHCATQPTSAFSLARLGLPPPPAPRPCHPVPRDPAQQLLFAS